MDIAIWSSRFETGIALIDDQHRSLFEALNRLAESFREGAAQEQARQSLDFLADYTKEHFQAEERFMRELGYPQLDLHMDQHAEMLQVIADLQTRQANGASLTMEVTILMVSWLKEHIHDSDLDYVDFLKQRARE